MDRLEGTYSARSCGAIGDGRTDDSAAIQEAIDKAEERGGNVYLPPGRYRVTKTIEVKSGVIFYGAHEAPSAHTLLSGSVILACGESGDPDGPPLFHLHDSAKVSAITVFYPDQDIDDIKAYPWTFHLDGADQTLEHITLMNSYQGIRVGPALNCRHRLRSVHGCVLHKGILVDNCWEIGRIENCQFHPHWWSRDCVGGNLQKAMKYMQENLDAFTFGKAGWQYLTNNFVFAAKIGWRFGHTEYGDYNGHMTGCGADGTKTAIQVDQLHRMGLLVTGGEFVAQAEEDPVHVRVAPECSQGNLRFVNCAFWGGGNRIAELNGDIFVSFNDCYFTSRKEGKGDLPLIQAKRGRLQLNNCSFDTLQLGVELGPELRHAILRGNNGRKGFTLNDQTGGRAIIQNNEPPENNE